MRILLQVWIKSPFYRRTHLSPFSKAASSTSSPWLLWVHETLQITWALHPGCRSEPWGSAVVVSNNYNGRRVLVRKEMFGTLPQRDSPLLASQLGGYGLRKAREHLVQPFHGWFLSFLGHDKSPSKPVKRHSPDSANNDLSCLASFWCSQRQSRAGGNKTWSCWNAALPRHNVMSARPVGCCLKHVQQCKQSPCREQNHSGPVQGYPVINVTVPYANILLLAVRLVPAKFNLQIQFSWQWLKCQTQKPEAHLSQWKA